MTTIVHVLGLCGSLRRGSFNLGLLHAAQELAPPSMQIGVHDIGPLPFFCPDWTEVGEPASVCELKTAIGAADGLLIATPEYNAAIPGVLKNVIDWASQPRIESVLHGKPTAIVGCTTGSGGTQRAQIGLRQMLAYVNALTLPSPALLVSHAHTRFDGSGRLSDTTTRDGLALLLARFLEWIVDRRAPPESDQMHVHAQLRQVALNRMRY